MKIKTHPPVTVLYSSHRTTLKELKQLQPVVKDLYTEAANNALISGPLYWIYHGADGKPDTEFTLEIAIPIQGQYSSSKFLTKQLTPFKAVTCLYEGSYDQIYAGYSEILQYIDAHKIPINEESRELYLNVDFQQPENCVTEIQVGAL